MHKKRSFTRRERGGWENEKVVESKLLEMLFMQLQYYVSQIDRLELFEGTTCEFIVLYSKE